MLWRANFLIRLWSRYSCWRRRVEAWSQVIWACQMGSITIVEACLQRDRLASLMHNLLEISLEGRGRLQSSARITLKMGIPSIRKSHEWLVQTVEIKDGLDWLLRPLLGRASARMVSTLLRKSQEISIIKAVRGLYLEISISNRIRWTNWERSRRKI